MGKLAHITMLVLLFLFASCQQKEKKQTEDTKTVPESVIEQEELVEDSLSVEPLVVQEKSNDLKPTKKVQIKKDSMIISKLASKAEVNKRTVKKEEQEERIIQYQNRPYEESFDLYFDDHSLDCPYQDYYYLDDNYYFDDYYYDNNYYYDDYYPIPIYPSDPEPEPTPNPEPEPEKETRPSVRPMPESVKNEERSSSRPKPESETLPPRPTEPEVKEEIRSSSRELPDSEKQKRDQERKDREARADQERRAAESRRQQERDDQERRDREARADQERREAESRRQQERETQERRDREQSESRSSSSSRGSIGR